MAQRWSAVLARLGIPTGDGRLLSPGAVTNRDLPLPLLYQPVSGDGHDGSSVVGRIDNIDYSSDMVTASGVLLESRFSGDVIELIGNGVIGPSVDLDDLEYTYDEATGMAVITKGRIAGATLVAIPAFAEVSITLASGQSDEALYDLVASVNADGWSSLPIADAARAWDGAAAAERIAMWAGVDQPDASDAAWAKYARGFLQKKDGADPSTRGAYGYGIADIVDGELTIIPDGVFAAAAAVQGSRGADPGPDADAMRRVLSAIYKRLNRTPPWDAATAALIASAATPIRPPLDYFRQPALPYATPLTVMQPDENGFQRVFGHIAPWGECHVGLPGCVTAPHSMSDYAHFLTGVERTDGGDVPVGVLTVGGGHAAPGLGFKAAVEHYDNVGSSVASVNAGEDEFGIWVAGYVIPDTPDSMVSELLRHPPSGDWREVAGNLELIAVCAVNSGGFPITRPLVKFSMGRQKTLIGAFGAQPQRTDEFPSHAQAVERADDAELAWRKARVAWTAATMRQKGR